MTQLSQRFTTWAELDLDALVHNLKQAHQLMAPGVKLAAVIKGNAYGHGGARVAPVLAEAGVDFFAVSELWEVEAYGLDKLHIPCLVLVPLLADELEATGSDVHLTISSLAQAQALEAEAHRLHRTFKVHVKVDTGMGRLGPTGQDAANLVSYVAGSDVFDYVGLYSHFATVSPDDMDMQAQYAEFQRLLAQLESAQLSPPLRHIAASSALVLAPWTQLDMVRAGLLLYGAWPDDPPVPMVTLKPVMSLHSRLVQLKMLPAGRRVSYGLTYQLKRDTRVAVAPIGYAHGLDVQLSNAGCALVHGQRCAILGRICMGMTLLDVTDVPATGLGDVATFLGRQGNSELTIAELAELAGTPRQHVTCSIPLAVPRIYLPA